MMSNITELHLFHSHAINFLCVCMPTFDSFLCDVTNVMVLLSSEVWTGMPHIPYFACLLLLWSRHATCTLMEAGYTYALWNLKHELQTMLHVKMLFVVWTKLNLITSSSSKCFLFEWNTYEVFSCGIWMKQIWHI
jgi:hypothetical protein